MNALIAGASAASDEPVSFLLPIRQTSLLRWAARDRPSQVVANRGMDLGCGRSRSPMGRNSDGGSMRRVIGLLCLSAILWARPGLAEDDLAANALVGSWHLLSFELRVVEDDGAPRHPFGEHPIGRIVLTSAHTMAAFISAANRKPSTNQAEAAALLASMTGYTGKFRIEGDKFITTVDGAWNEIYRGTEQVRYFRVDGDKLSIRTPEQASAILPGKRTVATLVWERER